MKNYLLLFIFLQVTFSVKAQSGFDALWKKYDSIQKVDNSNNTDNYKSIPTVDKRKETIKIDSVSSKIKRDVVKDISTKPIEIKKDTATKLKDKVIEKNDISVNKINDQKDLLKSKLPEKSVVIEKPKQIATKPVLEKPTVKSVEKSIEKPALRNDNSMSSKSNFDTTKNIKEFSFETTPIINGNATYNKPNPIKPLSANEIIDKTPVNKTIISKGNEKEDVLAKANYSEFSKEAETIRRNNDKKLDSVLKTMQLNIPVQFNPNEYVDIYVNGGTVLNDDNSKMYDRISILNAGRIHREYKTKKEGDQRIEKNISREQLVKLAQYIIDLGFFDFKSSYDCTENDAACNERLTTNPVALPLQLTITVGERKSKVYVAVYSAKSEKNWVNYPSNLDKIMAAIYSVVEK